jgi:hypothetical protein
MKLASGSERAASRLAATYTGRRREISGSAV